MTIAFVPFKAADAYRMEWIDGDDFVESLESGGPMTFQILEAEGQTQSMVDGDTIFGFITVCPKNKFNVYVNMYMSTAIQQEFGKDVYVAMKEFVDKLSEQYPRVYICSKADNDKLHKLEQHLGFKTEALMRKFGWRGEDYIMSAIIRE